MLYFVLKYLFAGTLKYKPFVNLSIILLLFISYKGIKLTLKWIFPCFLVIFVILPCLELEIEMYIFFHILIKVEISLLYKLLSYYGIKLIRASKHAYTLSLGSKNFVTAFILLSRRCP